MTTSNNSPAGQGDIEAVRLFIAERTTNPEHRQDVLDGDYDWSEWFGHVQAALAARQPTELIAQKVGDYRVTVAEDAITVSHGRDIVFAYSAGDPEPINARQSVGQEPAMYQVRPRNFNDGEGWREVTKREYDDRGPFPGYDESEWERRTLYAAPLVQAVDLGQFVPAERPLAYLKVATYHEALGWNECRRSMLALIDSQSN